MKGRGVQGSATTMEEGGKFESIEKGGSVKGPQKCERSPATARAPDLLSAATLCVP